MKRKVIVSILTLLISIPLLMDTPLAEAHGPNNIVYTPYGTCTSEFYYEANNAHNVTIGGITIPQLGPVNVIRYTFTHPYTGTFDLDITISGVLSNIWDLITSNCYLMSVVDETTLRFAVNNAEYCEIAIMPSQYYNQLVFFLKNQNLTPVEDTTTAVNNILTHVTYMDGQIQQIHADTTMVRNLLISMSGYTADSNDNIATDMDTLISAMNQINGNLSVINQTLKQNLNRIEWHDTNSRFFGASIDNATYSIGNINGNHIYLGYVLDPAYLTAGAILKVTIPYQVENYNQIQRIYVQNPIDILYWSVNRNDITLYMKVHYKGSNLTIQIQADNNTQFTYMSSSNTDTRSVQYITYNDDEYFNILGYFDNRKDTQTLVTSIQAVESAIRNMAVNVNNLTVNATGITYNVNNTQINNSVTEYNTNINQVYNIENSLSTNFDTYNQQFTPDFTDALDAINGVPAVMNNVIVDLYNLPFIKYPVLITLVGIVLLAILGV